MQNIKAKAGDDDDGCESGEKTDREGNRIIVRNKVATAFFTLDRVTICMYKIGHACPYGLAMSTVWASSRVLIPLYIHLRAT